MRQASAKVWIGGTVALAVLLLVAAWFLLIDPVVARAATDTAAAETQRDQNDLLELEIAKLAEQSTHLEEYKAELASLRVEMPSATDPANLSRDLDTMADGAGVTITSLQPSVPEMFVPTAATAATSVTADAATVTDDDATNGTADAAAAEETTAVAGFYQVPVSVTVMGSYDASVAFLRSLQDESGRLFLVSSITATTQEDQGATSGRPATTKGDVELAVTGYAFVLTDPSAVPADDSAQDVPVPSGQTNPFQPGR
jgi:Tfp pilus assembly protein PilO